MKFYQSVPSSRAILSLAIALAAVAAPTLTNANPYATCLTNTGGVVSFRLNEAADFVKVIWNAGASSTNLGAKAKGLTITNLGASVTSPFQVQVVKIGNNVVGTNTPVTFNSPRALAVNYNPKSPFFGRVYVGNSATNASRGDGIYALHSDFTFPWGASFTDSFGIIRSNRLAGIDFVTGGASSPWRMTVGEDDDQLYITDWSDAAGNLYSADQEMTASKFALQQLGPCLNGLTNSATDAGNPPGIGNNHGSVAAVAVFGSTANSDLTILTVDEDLQDDRTSTAATQMNSVWRYDVGNNALPYAAYAGDANPLTNRLLTPNIQFVSNVEGLSHGPGGTNGYLYFCQARSAGNEPGVYVVTNIYTAAGYAWNDANVWNSKAASAALGSTTDILKSSVSTTVSRDGRWLAAINTDNNIITVVRLTNGIPDLARILQFTGFTATASGRDLAWDAADNLYVMSSGLAMINSINFGLTVTNTTGSDGTFVSAMPSVVSVEASAPNAHRTDITGMFTLYRDGDVSQPLTVRYSLSGTASNGVDYVAINLTNITFAAGASSTNITITPLPSSGPLPPRPLTLTLGTSTATNYNLVEGRSATVVIQDNQIPQLAITRPFVSMYERQPNDFARFTISRVGGETNIGLTVNVTYTGNAVENVDYTDPGPTLTLAAGALSKTFDLHPMEDSSVIGTNLIVTVTIADDGNSGLLYTAPSNNVGNFTIIDSDFAPENVIFSEDFDAYAGLFATNVIPSGWTFKFAANNGVGDYNFTFGYDYSLDGIPPAPGTNSTGGVTSFGLKATVNKYDATALGAAALNFYPVGQVFSNDYSVRFNMLLRLGRVSNTEHALFGINHSGSKTNWYRSGGMGLGATNQDGLWFAVNGSGGNNFDDILVTTAAGAATAASNPTILSNRLQSTMTQVFKNVSLATGPYAATGSPGSADNGALNWVDVQIDKTTNMVVLKMNNQVIIQTTNVTAFQSGNIMVGYNDMFDSIGDYTNAAVYYDNIRVVGIQPPQIATQPSSVVAAVGSPASFTVGASTTTGVTNYQWFLNGNAIANATNATYSIGSVVAGNYGSYYVVVDNGSYPVQSVTVTLTPPGPVITVQPTNQAGFVGGSATFSVVASTSSGVTNYQWRFSGTNMPGKTSASLVLLNLQATNFGPYVVVVSDGFNSVTSSPAAQLTVALRPTLTNGASGGTFTMKYASEVGPRYVVEYKTNLMSLTWTPLVTNVGTGSPITVTDSISAAPVRFYRVRLQ